MDVDAARALLRHFDDLEDSRMERTRLHALGDILFITICGVICGADGWTEGQVYGETQWHWLETVLLLPNGMPSHDTFGRVFGLLDPEQLERCFQRWMASLAEVSQGRLIAIDGGTPRAHREFRLRHNLWAHPPPGVVSYRLSLRISSGISRRLPVVPRRMR